jgi:hypothetical protein
MIPTPGREKAGLVGAEIRLNGGIERYVAFIVAEQVELNQVCTRACQVEGVDRIAVR